MENGLLQKMADFVDSKRSAKRKRTALTVLCSVLAFIVTYISIIPAITLTAPPKCGLEEHIHTDACYESVTACGLEETPGHSHTDACYADVKTLVCPLEENADHTHGESCYITERELVCGLEETPAHTHTDACYETSLVCGKTEHTHTEACYASENPETTEEHSSLTKTYNNGSVSVTVELPEESRVPAEAQLSVMPITAENNAAEYKALVKKAEEAVLDENQVISDIVFYDISLVYNGEIIEPADGEAKVSLRFGEPLFSMEAVERASELSVLHFSGSGEVEDVTDIVENAEEGVTAVEFSTDGFSPFCIVLEDTTQTGNFYQRVSTIDSTSATYLIVSAQGSYAFSRTQTGYSRKAILNQVKGNESYYTATVGGADASGVADINWQFNTLIPGTSGTSRVYCVAGGNTRYLRLGNATFISTTAENQTLTYNNTTDCWTIAQSSYYLYMSTVGTFARSNSTSNTDYRNVLIYKLVNTTLTIPGDVIYDDGTGHGGGETKPDYPDYITPSGAQSAVFTAAGNKTVSAVSDPASSQIESRFTGVKADDGKVFTDKSVIYRDDDYNAFSSYPDGVFGVTMSTLAQEFNIAVEQTYEAPIDVVLILDTSLSMTMFPTSGTKRSVTAVNALNDAIDFIMSANPDNRVGVVHFSAGSADIMELGRYYVGTAGATINYSTGYNYLTLTGTGSYPTLATNAALRYADTRQLAPTFSYDDWYSTYTQHGIARAAAMLLRNTDTTIQTPQGDTINRTPAIIMLSDGDPTHCTPNYMDVLNGPHYGNGVPSDTANNQGILGYYTILSANYYKMQVSIHYEEVAKYFSIGLGINATGYQNVTGDTSISDSNYKRCVLNPTTETIASLNNTSMPNYSTTNYQLRDLLNGSFGSGHVSVPTGTATQITSVLGITNRAVPVLLNRYTNYKYADDAFFGEFTGEELNDVLEQAIIQSREVYNYGFILESSTDVNMDDPLGAGMEIKGPPVLRHNGVNYAYTSTNTVTNGGTTTVTYHYNYQTADPYTNKEYNLNNIDVTVITDSAGNQTVQMFVPEAELSVLQPDSAQSFYYESLPVRLIYQVGLTDAALAAADEGDVFYTNRWDGGISSIGSFLPTDDNPFYSSAGYQNLTENKSANPTATAATRLVTSLVGDTATHNLGNNGRLTITDAPDDVSVTANKSWFRYDGIEIVNPAELALLPDVTVSLYQRTSPGSTGGTLFATETFGHAEGWTYTWTGLPADDGAGATYYYYVTEATVNGYWTDYENNGGIESGIVTVNNTAGGMVLPETGGRGLNSLVTAGLFSAMLSIAAALCMPFLYKRERKLGRRFIRPPDG